MEKIKSKKEEDYANYCGNFLWDILHVSFQYGYFAQVPNGLNLLGNCRGHLIRYFNLCLIHFNQSHSCVYIKKGCITMCVNMVVTECVKY